VPQAYESTRMKIVDKIVTGAGAPSTENISPFNRDLWMFQAVIPAFPVNP